MLLRQHFCKNGSTTGASLCEQTLLRASTFNRQTPQASSLAFLMPGLRIQEEKSRELSSGCTQTNTEHKHGSSPAAERYAVICEWSDWEGNETSSCITAFIFYKPFMASKHFLFQNDKQSLPTFSLSSHFRLINIIGVGN